MDLENGEEEENEISFSDWTEKDGPWSKSRIENEDDSNNCEENESNEEKNSNNSREES